jgi:hypothetical protein
MPIELCLLLLLLLLLLLRYISRLSSLLLGLVFNSF